jgi:hypothetical protein
LPDGESEIFLQTGLDTSKSGRRSDLPIGQISNAFPCGVRDDDAIELAKQLADERARDVTAAHANQ